jgi:tetratricopeptide (TPR) repeat protein
MRAGRYLDAQLACRQALALNPAHADTLHLMGLLSFQAKHYDQAVEWISLAVRQDPKTDYLANLGNALRQCCRSEEALKVFDAAVQLKPDDADLWSKLAAVLASLERNADALLAYRHALKLDPRHWESAFRSGELLVETKQFEAALSHFDICDGLGPDDAATWQSRGRALRGLNRFEECLAACMRAHALDPASAIGCNNVGNALVSLGKPEEGLIWFDKALSLQPDAADVLSNKAFALAHAHRFDEAFAVHDRVAALDPDNAKFAFYRSHDQLLTGQFEAGWSGREARWKVRGLPIIHPDFAQPLWLGNGDVEGKTLLIYADEGLGDTLQFVRYVPMVAALGAHVILVVSDALHPLLSGLPGIRECRAYSCGWPAAFDMYCPLLSLPLAFGTRLGTIPPVTSLPPPDARRVRAWEDRLGPHDRLRVGLVWSGNPNHINDCSRSIPLRTMAPLFDAGATFVSLQKDPRHDDKTFSRARNDILDLTPELTDFTDTAALISCLDLVITVDTSVAHLAGTLGCPTWILLPHLPDWRWLLDREDSPWYPGVRLFRQTANRSYSEVIDRVREELCRFVAGRARES